MILLLDFLILIEYIDHYVIIADQVTVIVVSNQAFFSVFWSICQSSIKGFTALLKVL